MKKLLLAIFAVFLLLNTVWAQSGNSNIGTEFWTGWMAHINGATGTNASQMNLYIACDVATTGTVSAADGSFSTNFSVSPNQITIFPVPASAYLGNTNGTQNKGLHIVSKNPIAVYAHIYASSVSGATLLLPVNTMTTDYYSLNYTQLSNSSPSYSTFMVIATDDNTTVKITPTAPLIDGTAANSTITINLNKGQLYQGISNTDLTGTHIVSTSTSTTGCKKIAVFSGSNKIYIGAPNKTSDNLFQQVYPTATWGKTYITVPLKARNYDIIRIVKSDATANVTVNGTLIPATSFNANNIYDFNSQVTNNISSDKPIQVVQYAVTQSNTITGSNLAGDVGDPEMIYLNPLEQTIDHVILYSANEYLILKSYINVVIPSAAASSFLLDGASQANSFSVVPNNTAYSYAQFTVTSGATHTISASQGFNAIAYGFGNAESYGYAAGTNVKNLNEYIQYTNPVTKQVQTSGCTGTSIVPEVIIPYQTTSITWDLGNGTTPTTQNLPTPSSSFVKNGVTLYVYDYSSTVTYTPGTYAIKVTVVDPVTTVCGSTEEIDLNFVVSNPPTAKFASRDTICNKDTIGFKDLSLGNGSVVNAWRWSFGNGDTSVVQNPVYTYSAPGDYTVSLTVSNASACQDVYTKKVHIRAQAVADFQYSSPDCETFGITFTDKSIPGEGKITKRVWTFTGSKVTETNLNDMPFTHSFLTPGTDTVTLQIFTDKGCFSTTTSKIITVHPHPVVSFTLPDVCLVNSIAQFTDKSTISDNSSAQFKYLWNFGDTLATANNQNIATIANPTHQFTKAGIYHVTLSVTSKDSCTFSTTKDYTVSGQANFTAVASACLPDTVAFTDKTDASNKVVSSWHWDFGTGDTSAVQNPKYVFKTPGNYNVTLTVTGHSGCSTTMFTRPIHIKQLPTADFSPSTPTCETQNVTFTDKSLANEGNIKSWLWDFGDSKATSSNPNTSTLQNPTHVFSPYATYTVKLTVQTDSSCYSTTVSKPVVVNPQPVASFPLPDVCINDAGASFNAVADGNPQTTYSWDFGDTAAGNNVSASNPNTTIGTSPNVKHHYNTQGNYNVRLTVTTPLGCTADTLKEIRVNGSTPVAAFDVPNQNTCSSSPVLFVNEATIPGFGDQVSSVDMYYDVVGNPTVKTHYDRPQFKQVFSHLYPLENTHSHTYTVHMVANSGATCNSVYYEQKVTVLPVPSLKFNKLPNLCQGAAPIDLSAYVTAGSIAGNGVFYLDGINNRQSNIFDPQKVAVGPHTIYYIYTANNAGSCADTLSQTDTIAPIPTVDAGPGKIVLAGESVILQGSSNPPAGIKILWTPATGLSDPTILTPTCTPNADTHYTLTVTLTTGGIMCPVSDTVTVHLLHYPIPPNTFTPNGDGTNDTWDVKYLDQYTTCTVKIFNRAGQMVYHSDAGYSSPWNGTENNNGLQLPIGTYYYIIDPKHNLKILSGSVNIIR